MQGAATLHDSGWLCPPAATPAVPWQQEPPLLPGHPMEQLAPLVMALGAPTLSVLKHRTASSTGLLVVRGREASLD